MTRILNYTLHNSLNSECSIWGGPHIQSILEIQQSMIARRGTSMQPATTLQITCQN